MVQRKPFFCCNKERTTYETGSFCVYVGDGASPVGRNDLLEMNGTARRKVAAAADHHPPLRHLLAV